VHRSLGPGLLESAYKHALSCELHEEGISFQREVPLPMVYGDTTTLGCAYRLDFLIRKELIVEVKSVARFLPVHSSQVLTYLRLSGVEQALLFNFNVAVMRHGIKSFLLTAAGVTAPVGKKSGPGKP
jgi:GxxExxY protein